MTPHAKIYMKFFDYGIDDFIPCERCGSRAVDVHHIHGRGIGKNVIENLAGLCRACHTDAEMERITPGEIQEIHFIFISTFKKRLT